MTVTIAFRVALHLVTRRRLENSWRSVAILLSCAYAMLLALGSLSVYLLLEREQARVDDRWPILASPDEPTRLLVVERDDDWDGDQFPVFWIEPVTGVAPVLPPGLPRMLEPGEAAVSPRLDELTRKHLDLAARYPDRIVVGNEGLQNPDELIAYYRPVEGRSLGESPFIIRVAAFGQGPAEQRGPPLSQQDPPNGTAVALGLLALAVVPGMVLLACGLAALSSARQHRFQVLQWLGGPVSMLAAVSVFEVLILAVPSAVIMGAAWYAVSGQLEAIPFLGRPVLRGDLQPSIWACLVATGGFTLVAVLLAAAEGVLAPFRRSSQARPGLRPMVVSRLRLALLTLPWLLLVLGARLGGYRGAVALMSGLILIPPAAVSAVPHAVRAFGRLLRAASAPALLIAGRRMEWDPFGSGRPFLGVTALAVLLIGTTGYIRIVIWGDQPRSDPDATSYATIGWLNPAPGDIERLRNALGSDTVVVGLARSQQGAVTIYGSCPALARVIRQLPCNVADPFELSPVARALLPKIVPPQVPIRLGGEGAAPPSGALVISGESQDSLQQRSRTAAMTNLPAPTVQNPAGFGLSASPLVRWLTLGIAAGASALVLGTVLLAVNGVMEWRHYLRPLIIMGIRRGQLQRLQVSVFALPFAVHAGLGLAIGLPACWFIVSRDGAPMPWSQIGLIATAFAVSGAVGSALLYYFAPALQLRDQRE